MKLKKLIVAIVCCASLAAIQSTIAASDAIKTMAGIMMGLNHYPSDSEKATLQGIVDGNASAAEKACATAMINLQHSATAADKKKLGDIIADDSTPGPVRAMAKIIANLNHMPSGDDKKVLKDLMN